jgi:MEMO1 family protein
MFHGSRRPQLRSVETIVVPDPQHGTLLVLRDTQGVATGHARIPPALIPIVARFDGHHTCEQIAREASAELGEEVTAELVSRIADELEQGLFLHGPTFRRARADVERHFADAEVRAATHAGGAYHADPGALREYLEKSCLDRAKPTDTASARAATRGAKPLTGLIAPHIDPWRGAVGYGHAYAALAARLPPAADTFVLLGTSHAPMKEPFALCKKAFATPLGDVEPDREALDLLARSATFDPYADQFNHKREHSLEFQAVFLKHLLDSAANGEKGEKRKGRIVPILAGLGEHQATGSDPARDAAVMKFLDALRDLVASRPGRVVVIAGADLAHVGPRFGDAKPLGERERAALEESDRTSLDHATSGDASGFWKNVAKDLTTRRVCGLAPIFSLLRALPGARGELLHYEQTIDAEDGSIVSHAGVGFTIA